MNAPAGTVAAASKLARRFAVVVACGARLVVLIEMLPIAVLITPAELA